MQLPGQLGMDPLELCRRLEHMLGTSPSLSEGGPLDSDEMKWIGRSSALISKLGDLTIMSEAQLSINRLNTPANRLAAFEKLLLVLHKALAHAELECANRAQKNGVIPASDRTVLLGHNSDQQKQALEKVDELVRALNESNDFPGEPEDKEQVLAELSAGRKLLEATKVRIGAVRATLQPALRWILEKAGGAMIGKMAGDLWEYLVHLKF